MFALNLFKITARMCKITPQIYEKLYQSYVKVPHESTFGKYYKPQNLLQIFNIIKHTNLKNEKKMLAYQSLAQNLCGNQSDMQFNVLANIYKQRATIFMIQSNYVEATKQIQNSIKAMAQMKDPFDVQVGNLLQLAGGMYAAVKNIPKALKYLKEAEHIYNQLEQQILQNPQIPKQAKQQLILQVTQFKADTLTQSCIIHFNQQHLFEARQYASRADQLWKKINDKNNIKYLLLVRCKCVIHILSKQNQQAVQIAREYLEKYQSTPQTQLYRLYFKQILAQYGGDQKYAQQVKNQRKKIIESMKPQESKNFLQSIGIKLPDEKNKQSTNNNKDDQKDLQTDQQNSQNKINDGRKSTINPHKRGKGGKVSTQNNSKEEKKTKSQQDSHKKEQSKSKQENKYKIDPKK